MRWFLTAISALAIGLALGRSGRRTKPVADGRPPAPVAAPPIEAAVGARADAARPPIGRPWRLVFGAVLIAFGVVAAVYFAYELRSVITLGLVALLLAVGLQGPIAYLHRRFRLPRPLGLLMIYLAVIVGLVLAGWLLLPSVFADLRALATAAPTYLQEAQAQLGRFGVAVDIPRLEDLERRALAEVTGDIGGYVNRALSILGFAFGLFGGALNVLLMLVLSVFIIMEGPGFRRHLLSLLSAEREQQWELITRKIAVKIQGWMLGTLFLGLVIGSITTVALLVMGMPYAFLLGLIAGLGELIPMIGPIIAAVPAVGIAAFQGLGMFAAVLVFYIVIQQLENYVLVPRIMGASVDLPGLGVLVAFLIGSELMGVTGGILAMPAAAVIQVLWLDWIVPAIRGSGDTPSTGVQVTVGASAPR